MLVDEKLRSPVNINSLRNIRFDCFDVLHHTYCLPRKKVILANDHHLLYYWVKTWQLKGVLASEGLTEINFDAHSDTSIRVNHPPDMKIQFNKSTQANRYWEYMNMSLHVANFHAPLVIDGSLSDLFWLRNEFSYNFIDQYKCMRENPVQASFQSEFDLFIKKDTDILDIFDQKIRNVSAGHLILSLDLDYFVRTDKLLNILWRPRKIRSAEEMINLDSFAMFYYCMDLLKERKDMPPIFICTSSPNCNSSMAVKYALSRIESYLNNR